MTRQRVEGLRFRSHKISPKISPKPRVNRYGLKLIHVAKQRLDRYLAMTYTTRGRFARLRFAWHSALDKGLGAILYIYSIFYSVFHPPD